MPAPSTRSPFQHIFYSGDKIKLLSTSLQGWVSIQQHFFPETWTGTSQITNLRYNIPHGYSFIRLFTIHGEAGDKGVHIHNRVKQPGLSKKSNGGNPPFVSWYELKNLKCCHQVEFTRVLFVIYSLGKKLNSFQLVLFETFS